MEKIGLMDTMGEKVVMKETHESGRRRLQNE